MYKPFSEVLKCVSHGNNSIIFAELAVEANLSPFEIRVDQLSEIYAYFAQAISDCLGPVATSLTLCSFTLPFRFLLLITSSELEAHGP